MDFREDNLKQAGTQTYTRYAEYRRARTISEAMDLGATLADLRSAYDTGSMVIGSTNSPLWYLVLRAAWAALPTIMN